MREAHKYIYRLIVREKSRGSIFRRESFILTEQGPKTGGDGGGEESKTLVEGWALKQKEHVSS